MDYEYGFNGKPCSEYLFGTYSKVVSTLVFRSLDDELYELPDGTPTDGASARLCWGYINLLPAPVQNNPASWLHDHHYRTGWVFRDGKPFRKITRAEADDVFRQCLEAYNMSPSVCGRAYRALRLFGWRPWNAYRKHENARRKA